MNTRTPRAPYRAPTLRDHGTVADMTLEMGEGGSLDGAGYGGGSTGPTS